MGYMPVPDPKERRSKTMVPPKYQPVKPKPRYIQLANRILPCTFLRGDKFDVEEYCKFLEQLTDKEYTQLNQWFIDNDINTIDMRK